MPLSDREKHLLENLRQWENRLLSYESNDFQLTFEKYIERSFSLLPEKLQDQFFSVIDSWLFHLHAMLQETELQRNSKERILSSARAFQSSIERISDLKKLEVNQLNFLVEQQIVRHRFYSFAQGGISGSGGSLLLGMDVPAMAVINLRAIQMIAMTYGFELNTPHEMMASLRVFHVATLPKQMQHEGWSSLKRELSDGDRYFYEGTEEIVDISWIQQPVLQLLKAMVIFSFRHKTIQGIPLVSMAIGAGLNYQLTKKVTEFAHHYYLMRFLLEKEGDEQ